MQTVIHFYIQIWYNKRRDGIFSTDWQILELCINERKYSIEAQILFN